ncbi:uL30 family ribosomal protein [Candidatus Woesearchaeota archaeon]|nr:uL30 family ribosomal protein [Candidatus Woesearchaeota archaeon]
MSSPQKTKTGTKEETSSKAADSKNQKNFLKTKKETKAKGKLALILVRGLVKVRKDIKAALYSLRLRKKHACVVIEDIPSNRASVMKCKDYVTYGEITEDTLKLLLDKRGRKDARKKGYLKKFFLLHPPRGGFERKGVKTPFKKGGALGYRGAKINDLIKKML